eukprot:tig00021179_g19248.t1
MFPTGYTQQNKAEFPYTKGRMASHDEATALRGMKLLKDPFLNKGMAFTDAERHALGIRGLLPPRVLTIEIQQERVMENLRKQQDDLSKYVFLRALSDRNENLFYYVVCNNIKEIMPIIYTPVVGLACQKYGHIFRAPRGLYISIEDRGHVRSILDNWWMPEVKVIVVTDGERILGLGDLGTHGMGIPVGKLALYTACAGVAPQYCLPITLDVGTNNEGFLKDPLYTGLQRKRERGPAYDELIDEFIKAVVDKWGPATLIQFEDFGNTNAFRLLNKYREQVCTFNDDIQGTAAVTLAGIFSSLRITKKKLAENTFLFLGAGEAGTGIGDLIVSALVEEGVPEAEARKKCFFVDSKGLVCKSRLSELQHHKIPYAHDVPFIQDLLEAVKTLKPTVLVGVSAVPQSFTQSVVEAMAALNEQPLIFALSNPTSMAECTAQQCYTWTKGKGIFASGSPFDPVTFEGKTHVPGQGNNAYIFPGVGLGVVAVGAKHVPDAMFLQSARTLAALVTQRDLDQGSLYPPLKDIRKCSVEIAVAIAEYAFKVGLATVPKPAESVRAFVESQVYVPSYPHVLPSRT